MKQLRACLEEHLVLALRRERYGDAFAASQDYSRHQSFATATRLGYTNPALTALKPLLH